MELLARETLAKGSVDMISKIFDQNLEFVSLEHRLFSLDRPGSYVQYNDPTCPDAEVSALQPKPTSLGNNSVVCTHILRHV